VVNAGGGALSFLQASIDMYFGKRLIAKGTANVYGTLTLATVATDRLGSIGKFYPFGIERPSATTNDTEKFTGYYRDAATGLDYAKNRYEQPGVGRFMTPDPYQASAGPSDPGSWNRYAYVRGDPVNRVDRRGTDDSDPGNGGCGGDAFTDCNGGDPDEGCTWNSLACASDQGASAIMTGLQSYCSGAGLVYSAALANAGEFPCVQAGYQQGGGSTAPPPPPSCSIALYERPVDIPGTSIPTGYEHTYIDATVTNNGVTTTTIMDGGPVGGKLFGVAASTGLYPIDNPNQPGNQEIGSPAAGPTACTQIQTMENEVSTYDAGPRVPYNPYPTLYLGGWNSNSFTYTLLNSVGLAFSFGSTPSSAPGWGYQVPGLTSPGL